MNCNVPGCDRAAGRYGHLCTKHIAAKRNHGHPEQRPVSTRELRPWRATAASIIERNRHRDALKITEERWQRLLDQCPALIDGRDNKGRVHWPTVRAAKALLEVAKDATFEDVLATVSAVVLLREGDPRRFRSDDAFTVQLARAVRRLGSTAVAWGWNHKEGRMRGAYRHFPFRASLRLAELVIDAIGPTVMRIVATAEAEVERKVRLEGSYRAALAEIA